MDKIYHRIISLVMLVAMIGPLAISFYSPTPVNAALSSDNGTLFEDFENVADFTINEAAGNAVRTANTTYYKTGTQGMTCQVNIGTTCTVTKNISANMSAATNFVFFVYVPDITKFTSIMFYLSSVTNWTKYYSLSILSSYFVNGWNLVSIAKADMAATGGEVWTNLMLRLRWRYTAASIPSAIILDTMRYDYNRGARVVIQFDDGWLGVYDKAYPIMAANNQTGTAFIIWNKVDTANRVTLANLHTLYTAGWDIANHTMTHPNLTTSNATALDYEVNDMYDWLYANGFYRSTKLISYPGGSYNSDVITKVKENHEAGRTIKGSQYAGHDDPDGAIEYEMKCWTCTNVTAPATIATEIDQVIQRKGQLMLLFHNIVDSGADYDTYYLTSNFQTVSDYIKTKQDAGELTVLTYSEYLDELGIDVSTTPPATPATPAPATDNLGGAVGIGIIGAIVTLLYLRASQDGNSRSHY